MAARLSICGLLLALGGCCLEVIQGMSTGSTGGAPTSCADIVCQPPMVCITGPDCGPHCGCVSDANCATGQVCGSTIDCGRACVAPNCFVQFCPSGLCGANGLCCNERCLVGGSGLICSTPSGCDDAGLCVYPPAGTLCGRTCSDDMLTTKTCDGAGGCGNPKTTPCPGNVSCDGPTDCSGPCNADGGCAINYFCSNGTCAQQIDWGPCNGDNAVCASGLCAPNNVCCREDCPGETKFPECSIVACTADAGGSCAYPRPGILCDRANETCTGSTLNVGQCDGMGTCNLGTSLPCPNDFACNDTGTGCNTLCTADINCATGYYCDTKSGPTRGECLPQVADGG